MHPHRLFTSPQHVAVTLLSPLPLPLPFPLSYALSLASHPLTFALPTHPCFFLPTLSHLFPSDFTPSPSRSPPAPSPALSLQRYGGGLSRVKVLKAELKSEVPDADSESAASSNSPVYYWHSGSDSQAPPLMRCKGVVGMAAGKGAIKKAVPRTAAMKNAKKTLPRPAKRKVGSAARVSTCAKDGDANADRDSPAAAMA